MKQERRTTYACHDYLNTTKTYQASINNMPNITASDRQRVIDWCYDIIDQCHLNRETIDVAMNLADQFCVPRQSVAMRCCTIVVNISISSLQLCIVAGKMNEPTTFSQVLPLLP